MEKFINKNISKGDYEVNIYKKGKCETALDGKWLNGHVFYTVRLGDGAYFDVVSQTEAEVLSHLVRIEMILKKIHFD